MYLLSIGVLGGEQIRDLSPHSSLLPLPSSLAILLHLMFIFIVLLVQWVTTYNLGQIAIPAKLVLQPPVYCVKLSLRLLNLHFRCRIVTAELQNVGLGTMTMKVAGLGWAGIQLDKQERLAAW